MKCPHCGAEEIAHSPNAYWCKACGHFLTPPEADAAEKSEGESAKPPQDAPKNDDDSQSRSED
jgi:hypothetical protein